MNGFSDVIGVTYSTLSRWQLSYQRVFSTGAMFVAQLMAQSQGGMTMGTLFSMLQYPWVHGGCTQLQYVKQQQTTLSHMQKIIRGVYVGSQFSYDPNTHASSMSYAFTAHNDKKTSVWSGEMKPSSGEWKIAYLRQDWASDHEVAVQLENTEKRNGFVSLLSIGIRKVMVGGGSVSAAISGFTKLRAIVELPFGGERPGFNQVRFNYNTQYDIQSGGFKHGLTVQA